MLYELPALNADSTVQYELIDVPFIPTLLTRGTSRESSDVEAALRWLVRILPRRAEVARSVFGRLGAPAVHRDDPRPGLLELGRWIQHWFPLVAEPYVQRSYPSEPGWQQKWLTNLSVDRLGDVVACWSHQEGYSRLGDTLLHSLVVDLAALVLDVVPRHVPQPAWSVQAVDHHLLLVARPSTPAFAPLTEIRELLLQSVGPLRGERSRALRRRQSAFIADCFDQIVTGNVPVSSASMFPENRYRLMSRFNLKRPARSAPPATREVRECASALRRTGFYQSWRYDDDDLATALGVAWTGATGRRLPTNRRDLWIALILLDAERTWFEDVDVEIQGVCDQMYSEVVFSLERVGGPGFGGFTDPSEDWHSSAEEVRFTVRWRRRKRVFSLPKTSDGIVHPRLFTELNALLPEEGPQLHYLDIGPTVTVVLRLTADERRELGNLTGLDVVDAPPGWWLQAADEGLASLAPQRTDPLLMGTTDEDLQRQEGRTFSADSEELRSVSVTDMDVNGELVFHVFVSAAEFLRGGEVEDALEARITGAIRAVPSVVDTSRVDREVWEVIGDPSEAQLENAVKSAVDAVLSDYGDEISSLFA